MPKYDFGFSNTDVDEQEKQEKSNKTDLNKENVNQSGENEPAHKNKSDCQSNKDKINTASQDHPYPINDPHIKELYERFDDFDKFCSQLQQEHKCDPRPDIKEDHYIWLNLLRLAYSNEGISDEVYGMLHGLRACGCRVKRDKYRIKLDIDNSYELLDDFIDKDEENNVERISMFDDEDRQQARERAKKKEFYEELKKQRKEVAKQLKEDWLVPNVAAIKRLFKLINKQVKKYHDEYGQGFTLEVFNTELGKMENL